MSGRKRIMTVSEATEGSASSDTERREVGLVGKQRGQGVKRTGGAAWGGDVTSAVGANKGGLQERD